MGEPAFKIHLLRWIAVDGFEVDWALRVDSLSTIMMLVVVLRQLSSSMSIPSATWPMTRIPRFMSYLSLFTFAMLMLVTSDNLDPALLRLGGRGARLLSPDRLLVHQPSACAAAIKAFIVNRIGDFGFMLGIAATFLVFGSLQYDTIFAAAQKMAPTSVIVFGTASAPSRS